MIYGLLAEAELTAAEAIVAAVPCAEQVRFLKSGAEATSAAARIARAYSGREVIVNCGYRGWHDGWNTHRNDGGIPRALEGVVQSFIYNDLDSLETVLRANRGKVAAVMLDVAGLQKETARRGVLFRRTGCNFISTAHTDADVDRAVEAARAALQSLPLS